jgi:hypothetical protein
LVTTTETDLQPNEAAANGPLPGEVSLYEEELRCSGALSTPGYYLSLNGAENADAQRSSLFPCATFTGSFDGPNRVFAWRSEGTYQGTSFLNNRKPGELFILGGDFPPLKGPVPAGPFVAKADATTGAQIWRTYLDNANLSGQFIATLNLNILANGNVVVSWTNKVALLDGDTGQILTVNTLPTGPANAADASFKHVLIAPDGTLILKNQCRPTGSTDQGTMAMITGIQQGLKQANSMLLAVDPNTLAVLDSVELQEPASTPHALTVFDGRIAIYISCTAFAYRYFWDPKAKKLSQDESWVPAVAQEGQSAADAPTLMGDWIAIQTNGAGSKAKASSVVAVNQHDAKKMKTIFPFGELEEGEFSFAPPKCGGDPENDMVYSSDMGIGKFAGIRLDPNTGDMKAVWTIDATSSSFMTLIGAPDKRVLLFSVMTPGATEAPIMQTVLSGRYKEQVTWRDAATGRVLAESDFFEPLTQGSLLTPGFGGRIYFPSGNGFITLQVMPATEENDDTEGADR